MLQIRKSLVIKFVIRILVRGKKHTNTGIVTSDERKGVKQRFRENEAGVIKPIVKVVNVYHMA